MILYRQIRLPGVLFACGFAAVLAACSTSTGNIIADTVPSSVGVPADAPARPEAPLTYPAVHDMPPPRSAATLSAEEQEKLEHDLAAVKTRQEGVAGVTPAAKRKPTPASMPPAPPRIIPANTSNNSIY
jgi:hypothetical protein